jgi:dTDP-glucose pyrophosphorylase
MKKIEFVGLVPAAGEGSRMYPFSRAVPKEMYPILGKPVIEHCIENLKEGGINRIFLIVGHQKGALMDYLGDGSFYGVKVAYIYQLKRKGLGHAVLQAEKWIREPFVTLLGDSFIEPKKEIQTMMKLHTEKRPVATILLFKVSNPTGYGIAKFKSLDNNSGPIEKLIEKPTLKEAEEYKVNGDYYAICGGYVFEPKIFDFIKKTKPGRLGEIQLSDGIQLALEKGEKVYGVILKGKYLDIGKWKTVFNTEKQMFDNANINDVINEREEMTDKVIKTLE